MIDPVTNREIPSNLGSEPPYPGLEPVTFSLRYPDYVAHPSQFDCSDEYPHLISDCGLFD